MTLDLCGLTLKSFTSKQFIYLNLENLSAQQMLELTKVNQVSSSMFRKHG